jgi:hypothetical protein
MEKETLTYTFWIVGVDKTFPTFPAEKQALKALRSALVLEGLLAENASAKELLNGMDRLWGINEKWV